MKGINTKYNALIFSIFNSILIFIIVLGCSYLFSKKIYELLINEMIFVSVLVLVSIIASYLLILIAFQKQMRQNFSKLIEQLPVDKTTSQNLNISNISESIAKFKENKELEIVLLKDRENYRKEFFGNVAHELKTPLFSMQGFLLTLIEGGIDDENIKYKYLDRINKSLERLMFIIKDLDLLFELENRNLKLNIKEFNITALTKEIIELLEHKATKNKVSVILNDSITDIYVIGDVERIGQVLTNLIVNGISHAGKDAKITISFLNRKDGKIIISVKDNGIGIKPEHLDRLFERFYRVDEHRSRKQGGSGLGLSIVKNIVHSHKENIMIKSTFGQGTEFTFSLKKAAI